MTTIKSDKSTSFSGLNQQYRELRRKFISEAGNKDLKNVLVLLGSGGQLSPEVRKIVTILSASVVLEEICRRLRKGSFHVPSIDPVVANDPVERSGEAVCGEGGEPV